MSTDINSAIVPLRVGIRFNPPALVFVYEKSCDLHPPSVLRRRIMPIRDFNETSDVQCFARELIDRHGKIFFENVPTETVCKMLRILREHRKGVDLRTALETVEGEANEIKGVSEIQNNEKDNVRMDKTFVFAKDEIKSTDFAVEREDSYEVEVDRSWEDEGDDSLEMHLHRTITRDFVKDLDL